LELWVKPENNSDNLAVIYLDLKQLVWRHPAWYRDKIYLNIFLNRMVPENVLRCFISSQPPYYYFTFQKSIP